MKADTRSGVAATSAANPAQRLGPAGVFSAAILLTALWLVTRPYPGVYHDARFYAVQTLNHLTPGLFDGDLYFQSGSQDQFTIFSSVFAVFVRAVGLSNAAVFLTLCGQCLWGAGLAYFAVALFRDGRTAIAAMATAIALPNVVVFGYGDAFLTPRLFVEALTMFALGDMLRDRSIRSFGILAASALIHPIMALPGLVVYFLYQAVAYPVILIPAAGLVAAGAALGHIGIEPFNRIYMTFDPEWLAVVQVRDFFCFPTKWDEDWIRAASFVVLGAFGFLIARGRERRLLMMVGAGVLAALVGTIIGADLMHNVLVTDAQQYRAIWLLALLANMFLGAAVVRLPDMPSGQAGMLALTTTIAALTVTRYVGPFGYGAALPAAVVVLVRSATAIPMSVLVSRLLTAAIVLVLGTATAAAVILVVAYLFFAPAKIGPNVQTGAHLAAVFVLLGLILGQATLREPQGGAAVRIGTGVAAVGLLLVAASAWDQRTEWVRLIEAGKPPPDLTALLPSAKQIYWEGDVRVPWFLLRRPSYFSCAQGTGSLFFRGTAIEYQRRYDQFRPVDIFDYGIGADCPAPTGLRTREGAANWFQEICRSEPDLGALVLLKPLPGLPAKQWISPAAYEERRKGPLGMEAISTDRFYVYVCPILGHDGSQ